MIRTANSHCCGTEFDPSVGELQAVQCGQINKYLKKNKICNDWNHYNGGLQSMGSRRVGHGWATSLSLFTLMHWRRAWQPTPVFLPGESQGWGSPVGCRLWGRAESDTTEAT